MVDLSKPVVWTSRGNINEDDESLLAANLKKFSEWEFPNERTIVHIIGIRDEATGEDIKRGVYVYTVPQEAGAEVGQLN